MSASRPVQARGPGAADRRIAARKRVLKGGTITFASRQTAVPCVVRDMSDGGARLVADLAPHLPGRFQLIIEIDGIEADCEVIRRRGNEIGVRFTAAPRSASRRRVQALSELSAGENGKPSLRRQDVGQAAPVSDPPAAAEPARPAAARADVAARQACPILIAEDDPDDQAFLAEAFREIGFHEPVVFVEDGVELIQFLRGEGRHGRRLLPGLILLDLNMPRMDGRTALVQIKSMKEFRRIPVVVFSTSNVERDVETTYDLGIASYIPKPSSSDELTEIARMLTAYWSRTVRLPAR
jgi:two-component system response regulator